MTSTQLAGVGILTVAVIVVVFVVVMMVGWKELLHLIGIMSAIVAFSLIVTAGILLLTGVMH